MDLSLVVLELLEYLQLILVVFDNFFSISDEGI
jgi:hypothetical protein